MLLARSTRGGFSGPLGTYLSVTAIPVASAALWVLAYSFGWWTIAAFLCVSFVAGLLSPRPMLGHYVLMQPLLGLSGLAFVIAAWAAHLLR